MSVAQPVKPVGDGNVWLDWTLTVLFNIALPILTYNMLDDRFGELNALLLSGIWPVLELVLTILRRGHVDEFSIFVLITIVLGAVSALLFNSPRLLLVKASAVTGLIGLVLLLSMLTRRPLMFYFGRKFATDGSRTQVRWWNDLWRYPGFRRTQYVLTTVWGVVLLLESVIRVLLSLRLPVSAMVVVNSVTSPVIIVLLMIWLLFYVRRSQARALQHNPNIVLTPPPSAPAA